MIHLGKDLLVTLLAFCCVSSSSSSSPSGENYSPKRSLSLKDLIGRGHYYYKFHTHDEIDEEAYLSTDAMICVECAVVDNLDNLIEEFIKKELPDLDRNDLEWAPVRLVNHTAPDRKVILFLKDDGSKDFFIEEVRTYGESVKEEERSVSGEPKSSIEERESFEDKDEKPPGTNDEAKSSVEERESFEDQDEKSSEANDKAEPSIEERESFEDRGEKPSGTRNEGKPPINKEVAYPTYKKTVVTRSEGKPPIKKEVAYATHKNSAVSGGWARERRELHQEDLSSEIGQAAENQKERGLGKKRKRRNWMAGLGIGPDCGNLCPPDDGDAGRRILRDRISELRRDFVTWMNKELTEVVKRQCGKDGADKIVRSLFKVTNGELQ